MCFKSSPQMQIFKEPFILFRLIFCICVCFSVDVSAVSMHVDDAVSTELWQRDKCLLISRLLVL